MEWIRYLRDIHHQAESLGNTVRALEEARACQERYAADAEARYHLQAMVTWLIARLRPHHDPRQLMARLALADDDGLVPARPARPAAVAPGTCSAVLLDVDCSQCGFLVQIRSEAVTGSFAPPDATLGQSFRRALQVAQAAVLEHLLAARTVDLPRALRRTETFTVCGPPAAERLVKEGGSLGAAAAVAVTSRWCDRAVPEDLVVIGALDEAGRLGPVGGLEEKVSTVLRERPRTRKVIVPPQALARLRDPRIVPVADLGALLEAVFGADGLTRAPAAPLDVEGAVHQGVLLYEKHNDYVATALVMQAALEAIDAQRQADPRRYGPEELIALWRLGSALIHQGKVRRALAVFKRAEELGARLWREQLLSPHVYLGFRNNLAVLLRDTYRHAKAEACLLETLALQRQLRQGKRELARTLGNLGELQSFMHKAAEAEEALTTALGYLEAAYPEEVPRALCNLGCHHLRQRDPRRARDCFTQGVQRNKRVEHGHAQNHVFLHYGLARAALALCDVPKAQRAACDGLELAEPASAYPRQLLRACLGLSSLCRGAWRRGEAELRAAADTSRADGGLVRFGMATALGHLALALLQRDREPDPAQIGPLIDRLMARAREVCGLSDRPELFASLKGWAESRPVPRQELTSGLEALIRLFPYGIDPWEWQAAWARGSGSAAQARRG